MEFDIYKFALLFGKALWGIKEMTEEELRSKAMGFAEGLPFPVDISAICQEVAKGYAQAEAEYQQQLATPN